jgi:replicative DNA helicase
MMTAPEIQNIEAEAALLGALMMNAGLIDRIADGLAPSDFAEAVHGRIYSAIVSQHSAGKTANPVTLRPFFETDAEMKELGGPGYLAQLTGSGAAVVGAVDFARQIRELAQRRRLVEGLLATAAEVSNFETSLEELIEAGDDALSAARSYETGVGEHSAADCLGMVIDGFDEPVTGVLCGSIPSIDGLLGPLRPKDFIVGAGRPGMGKTAAALSYVLGAAQRGHGCLFFSLEMGAEQLAERMAADLCLDARIPYSAIKDRTLTSAQRMEVCRARDRIKALPLQILDKHGLTISQVRTMVRRWVRRFEARGQKLELVVIDYIQLVRGEKRMDRYETVSEVSRTLKEIAKEHGLTVLGLAQLSREVEKRNDKRPQLST